MIHFKNGILNGKPAGVLAEGGRIVEVGPDIAANAAGAETVIDCKGRTLLPGLIDLHVHLRDPGQEYKEDIASGTRAAAKGGVTSVCCMANTNPVNDSAAVTKYILDKAKAQGVVRVYPIGSVTKGTKGEELTEMGDLTQAGCVALSDDGATVPAHMMRLAMRYSLAFDVPIASHSENLLLASGGAMHEGEWSTLLGIKGIPGSAEETAISRDCALALETGARLHICHVSTKGSLDVIRHYKDRGARITCEATPHHICATDALCEGYDSHARVSPPLRSEEDRLAVIEALKDGTIDCIATDHAPHHMDEKNIEFSLAATGISGLETSLALCYTELVGNGHITLTRLMELMSGNPAKMWRLPGGSVERGQIADIVLFDPNSAWTIDRNAFASKGKNTPFHGFAVKGLVTAAFVGGKCVYMEDE